MKITLIRVSLPLCLVALVVDVSATGHADDFVINPANYKITVLARTDQIVPEGYTVGEIPDSPQSIAFLNDQGEAGFVAKALPAGSKQPTEIILVWKAGKLSNFAYPGKPIQDKLRGATSLADAPAQPQLVLNNSGHIAYVWQVKLASGVKQTPLLLDSDVVSYGDEASKTGCTVFAGMRPLLGDDGSVGYVNSGCIFVQGKLVLPSQNVRNVLPAHIGDFSLKGVGWTDGRLLADHLPLFQASATKDGKDVQVACASGKCVMWPQYTMQQLFYVNDKIYGLGNSNSKPTPNQPGTAITLINTSAYRSTTMNSIGQVFNASDLTVFPTISDANTAPQLTSMRAEHLNAAYGAISEAIGIKPYKINPIRYGQFNARGDILVLVDFFDYNKNPMRAAYAAILLAKK